MIDKLKLEFIFQDFIKKVKLTDEQIKIGMMCMKN